MTEQDIHTGEKPKWNEVLGNIPHLHNSYQLKESFDDVFPVSKYLPIVDSVP